MSRDATFNDVGSRPLLMLTSPRAKGEAVRFVQTVLMQAGIELAADGVFGPQTAAAVARFQSARALEADGIVGPKTWEALYLDATKPPEAPIAEEQPSSAALAALEVARRSIGVKEEPDGSNRTPFGEWAGVNGVYWCAIFVSYCVFVATNGALQIGKGLSHKAAGWFSKGNAFCPTILAWFKAMGAWHEHSDAAPLLAGDVVFFQLDKDDAADHIGFIESWDAVRRVYTTIEGNESNRVKRRERKPSEIIGAGRLGDLEAA